MKIHSMKKKLCMNPQKFLVKTNYILNSPHTFFFQNQSLCWNILYIFKLFGGDSYSRYDIIQS